MTRTLLDLGTIIVVCSCIGRFILICPVQDFGQLWLFLNIVLYELY